MSEYSNPKASDKNDRSEIGGQHGQTVHCLALPALWCTEQCRKPSSNSERSEKNLAESKSTCSTGTSIVCPQFMELGSADSTGCRFFPKELICIKFRGITGGWAGWPIVHPGYGRIEAL